MDAQLVGQAMRTLVFGTSNSILKNSYVDALRAHAGISRLDRIGPGGSSSIMLPYVGADVVFDDYDYVVLDTSINDGAFLGWGLVQPDEVRQNIIWTCHTALQAGCVPLFLCMPNRTHLEAEDPALAIYRDIAREFQFALIDGYAFARATAAADGVPMADLFTDDLHLRPEIAAKIVPQIIAACQPRVAADDPVADVSFRLITAKELALPQSERSTSLMKAGCATLTLGETVEVRLHQGEQLCGVAYNAGHTFGSLIFDGATKVAVNVRSHYFQKHDLVATVRQVSPAVAAQDGAVKVQLQRAENVTAELMGFVIRKDLGTEQQGQSDSATSAPAEPPALTFPPEEAAAITTLYANARVILEYGSGGSTVLAARQADTTTFSVESDEQWTAQLQAAINAIPDRGNVHLHRVNIGPTGPWGTPTDRDRWRSFIHYPTSVWERRDLLPPDLVLIDGRFRVGCFLATLMNITKPTTVLFDDYGGRRHYWIVEELLRPARMIGRMAVFEAEPRLLSPHELRRFAAYFFDPE